MKYLFLILFACVLQLSVTAQISAVDILLYEYPWNTNKVSMKKTTSSSKMALSKECFGGLEDSLINFEIRRDTVFFNAEGRDSLRVSLDIVMDITRHYNYTDNTDELIFTKRYLKQYNKPMVIRTITGHERRNGSLFLYRITISKDRNDTISLELKKVDDLVVASGKYTSDSNFMRYEIRENQNDSIVEKVHNRNGDLLVTYVYHTSNKNELKIYRNGKLEKLRRTEEGNKYIEYEFYADNSIRFTTTKTLDEFGRIVRFQWKDDSTRIKYDLQYIFR